MKDQEAVQKFIELRAQGGSSPRSPLPLAHSSLVTRHFPIPYQFHTDFGPFFSMLNLQPSAFDYCASSKPATSCRAEAQRRRVNVQLSTAAAQRTARPSDFGLPSDFDLRNSDFFRHLAFVIRHSPLKLSAPLTDAIHLINVLSIGYLHCFMRILNFCLSETFSLHPKSARNRLLEMEKDHRCKLLTLNIL